MISLVWENTPYLLKLVLKTLTECKVEHNSVPCNLVKNSGEA